MERGDRNILGRAHSMCRIIACLLLSTEQGTFHVIADFHINSQVGFFFPIIFQDEVVEL